MGKVFGMLEHREHVVTIVLTFTDRSHMAK